MNRVWGAFQGFDFGKLRVDDAGLGLEQDLATAYCFNQFQSSRYLDCQGSHITSESIYAGIYTWILATCILVPALHLPTQLSLTHQSYSAPVLPAPALHRPSPGLDCTAFYGLGTRTNVDRHDADVMDRTLGLDPLSSIWTRSCRTGRNFGTGQVWGTYWLPEFATHCSWFGLGGRWLIRLLQVTIKLRMAGKNHRVYVDSNVRFRLTQLLQTRFIF